MCLHFARTGQRLLSRSRQIDEEKPESLIRQNREKKVVFWANKIGRKKISFLFLFKNYLNFSVWLRGLNSEYES
jgi:hypothetical protein